MNCWPVIISAMKFFLMLFLLAGCSYVSYDYQYSSVPNKKKVYQVICRTSIGQCHSVNDAICGGAHWNTEYLGGLTPFNEYRLTCNEE